MGLNAGHAAQGLQDQRHKVLLTSLARLGVGLVESKAFSSVMLMVTGNHTGREFLQKHLR
jgi:hypothetical protein